MARQGVKSLTEISSSKQHKAGVDSSSAGPTGRVHNRARSSRPGDSNMHPMVVKLKELKLELAKVKRQLREQKRTKGGNPRVGVVKRTDKRSKPPTSQPKTTPVQLPRQTTPPAGRAPHQNALLNNAGSVDASGRSPSHQTVSSSTVSGATPKRILKKMPKVLGESRVITHLHNAGEYNPEDPILDKPLKAVDSDLVKTSYSTKRLGLDIRSRNLTRPALVTYPGRVLPITVQPRSGCKAVESELYGFLIYQFTLQPRTPEVMSRMVAKAKQFLNDHDMSQNTYRGWHTIIVKAVEAAMDIPEVESSVRRALQDYDNSIIRNTHASFVNKGELGRAPVKSCFPIPCLGGTKQVSLPSKLV